MNTIIKYSKCSISDAANLYKKSRATIYKDIKNNILSRGNDGLLDFSELLRVYGKPGENTSKRIDTCSIQNLNKSEYVLEKKDYRMNQGIIAIGAHPDDIELGCGASLAKLSKEGFDIFAIVLSNGSKGNPFNQNRIEETSQALSMLGVNRTFFLDFEDTKLALSLCEIIISLEICLKDISSQSNIARIYTMFEEDRHQDHRAIFDASIVAFRTVAQILCYETPSSSTYFNPKVFERIDEIFLEKKIEALKNHKSQMHRNYMSENFIRSVAIFRGQQAGFPLSEGFIPYKMIL